MSGEFGTELRKILRNKFPWLKDSTIEQIINSIGEGERIQGTIRKILDHPDLNGVNSLAVATALIVLGGQAFGQASRHDRRLFSVMATIAEGLASFGAHIELAGYLDARDNNDDEWNIH